MHWHKLSWPELDTLSPEIPVVIPLGSCEQHGHHLPVSVDTLQVEAIANEVETLLGEKMLLTQTLWLGSSHHHMDFPGTISLLPSVYSQVIRGIAESVLNAGFRRIFFLNGHGGNRVPAAQALTELIACNDHAESSLISLASWWEIGRDAVAQAGFTQPAVAHACEIETSLMLSLHADLVQGERITQSKPAWVNKWFDSDNDAGKKVTLFHRFHRITAAGSLGLPAVATADKGRELLTALVREISEFVKDFATWEAPQKRGPRRRD
jgi:creatinine amidohydrolase